MESQSIRVALLEQSARATATAARVRFFGVLAFLPLLGLLHFIDSPGWDTYFVPIAIFGLFAAALFIWRSRKPVLAFGPFSFVLDVMLIFEVQRRSMPGSPFPAGVAGFSLGLFALLCAMTASTMHRSATWVVTACATVAQLTLMHLAGVSAGAQVAAAVVLGLLAVTQGSVGARLRRMVKDLRAERQQVSELTQARKQIENLLGRSREQNDQLRALQSDKDALSSLLIHDLRAPLGALRANIEWLKQELAANSDPDVTDALAQSRQVTDRVNGMIGDLLNISRLESGEMPYVADEKPSRTMLQAIHVQLTALARERRIKVELEADDALLLADHALLQRALENISSNALRYTPAGGTIRLEGIVHGEELHFAVRNTGPVIPLEVRATLFDKYVQAGSTHDNRRAGWGLGLYFCKLCIDAHRGTIGVEDHEGWPTSFVIRVPGVVNARAAA